MSDQQEVISNLRAEFNLLSDEAKADVIKTQIIEHEQTERARIEQTEQTRRNLHDEDGYHVVRGMFVVFLFFIVAGATCVGYRKVDLDNARIRAATPALPIQPVTDAGR